MNLPSLNIKFIVICGIFKIAAVKSAPDKSSFDVDNYPYLVHIAHIKLGLWCSGTILSPNWILTSATCVTDTNSKTFKNHVAHPHDFTVIPASTLKHYDPQFICAKNFFVHSKFDFTTYENDIALIELGHEINLKEAKVINLANETDYINSLQQTGKLVNFKRDYKPENEQISKDYLKMKLVNGLNENIVTVIDAVTCRTKITAVIEDEDVCSLYSPNDTRTCVGDIGGPLIVNNIQIGIITFGIHCSPPSEGVVHTRVDKHLNWIKNTMSTVEWDFRSSNNGHIPRSNCTILLYVFLIYYFILL